MTIVTTQDNTRESLEDETARPRPSIPQVAILMLLVGIAWRIVDIFILGLGDTWLNVMPSKLFPLLITLAYFWRYRRTETGSVLGVQCVEPLQPRNGKIRFRSTVNGL